MSDTAQTSMTLSTRIRMEELHPSSPMFTPSPPLTPTPAPTIPTTQLTQTETKTPPSPQYPPSNWIERNLYQFPHPDNYVYYVAMSVRDYKRLEKIIESWKINKIKVRERKRQVESARSTRQTNDDIYREVHKIFEVPGMH